MKANTKKLGALSLLLILTIGIILISGCIGGEEKGGAKTSPEVKPSGTQTQQQQEEQQTREQTLQQQAQEQQTPQTTPQTPQQTTPQQQTQTQPTVTAPPDETPAEAQQKKPAPPVPQGFTSYKDTNRNWSIYYPIGWDVVFSGPNALNLKKVFLEGNDNGDLFRMDVKILSEEDVKKYESLSARAFFEQESANWITKPEGYRNAKIYDIEINEMQGIEHSYVDVGSAGVIETPAERMDVWLKKGSFVAVISFTGPEYSFGKYSELFDRIAGTFYLEE